MARPYNPMVTLKAFVAGPVGGDPEQLYQAIMALLYRTEPLMMPITSDLTLTLSVVEIQHDSDWSMATTSAPPPALAPAERLVQEEARKISDACLAFLKAELVALHGEAQRDAWKIQVAPAPLTVVPLALDDEVLMGCGVSNCDELATHVGPLGVTRPRTDRRWIVTCADHADEDARPLAKARDGDAAGG